MAALAVCVCVKCDEQITVDSTAISSQNELFTIVGKVNIRKDELDLENTRILVDDGQYVGFLRADGTFTIPGLASNSYVLEVSSTRNVYEPIRIDINTKVVKKIDYQGFLFFTSIYKWNQNLYKGRYLSTNLRYLQKDFRIFSNILDKVNYLGPNLTRVNCKLTQWNF